MPAARAALARPAARSRGQVLLEHDRRLGARVVAGVDEVGRGALAGPLVCAGVLLDLHALRGRRVTPLKNLNDSKQLSSEEREELYHVVLAAAAAVAVRVIPAQRIDSDGLHRSNLAGLRACLVALSPPAELGLVDGFHLGEGVPEHRRIVKGDATSACIAAASIVAKVTRDRLMRRLHELHPQYGFSGHVGYITPEHAAAVREHGPCPHHRLSFDAACLR